MADAKRKLCPYTLRWCARKAEKEAQLTYDERDSVPAEHRERWKYLDVEARALTNFGKDIADEARRLTKARVKHG